MESGSRTIKNVVLQINFNKLLQLLLMKLYLVQILNRISGEKPGRFELPVSARNHAGVYDATEYSEVDLIISDSKIRKKS